MQTVNRRWPRRNHCFDTFNFAAVSLSESSVPFYQHLVFLNSYSFLLGSRSEPSVSARIAHEHIAFACISHLIQILQFAPPDFQKQARLEAVGLGCLRLQRYASENWTFHVRKYTEIAGTELSLEAPLIRQLLRLTERHSFLSRALVRTHVQESVQASAATRVTDTWLQRLEALDPEMQNLISRVHCFQEWLAAEQLLNGPGMLLRPPILLHGISPCSNCFLDTVALESDNTLFSLANSNYQAVIELLLGLTSCDGLSAAELVAFQTEVGGTAFVCPVKGCDRSRLGYASAAELKDHKRRRHIQRLQCYQGKCVYNNVGYSNTTSLHQHAQKVHKKETPRIPTTLGLTRKRKIEDLTSQRGLSSGGSSAAASDLQLPLDKLEHIKVLQAHGVDPGSMSQDQLETFRNQSPAVRQRTMETYAENVRVQREKQERLQLENPEDQSSFPSNQEQVARSRAQGRQAHTQVQGQADQQQQPWQAQQQGEQHRPQRRTGRYFGTDAERIRLESLESTAWAFR